MSFSSLKSLRFEMTVKSFRRFKFLTVILWCCGLFFFLVILLFSPLI